MRHPVDDETVSPADPNASWPYSRRTLLKGAIGAALVGRSSLASALASGPLNRTIDEIVHNSLGIDLHNHYFYEFSKDPEHSKPDPENKLAASIQAAGLSAVIYNYCVDDVMGSGPGVGSPPAPNAYYQWHIQSLDYLDRALAKQDMRRALNKADLTLFKSRNRPTVIQGSEGCQWIEGKLERIGEAYGRGLRHAQLLHRAPDLVAPLGDVQLAGSPNLSGLTSFGAEVVRECNRLGIVVDLAHGTEKTVIAATRATRQPLVVSHTALASQSALAMVPPSLKVRLVSRDHAKAVADTGGIIGVWHLFPTLKDYVAGIRDMVEAVGVDHVGMGSDSPISPDRVVSARNPNGNFSTNNMWPDQKAGFLYAVVSEMLAQGFTARDIGKIAGANYYRVFSTVTSSRG